ncbi:PadR family transcriptional regulator [Devosia oryziradicis]|uniref:PadR family transcriptional regulator n=1 Tax=Devosia oryziradicis TaxID=2801335 RepID=A0ABX7BU98_9HYPH|nr:PadR family transcriptional regulator [Devosia oryziradicis]QQR35540.1 PadR family transcriptional regulator [Devosia oryziradicis]
MNVRTLCLSILYEGEATGYEIRRLCVEGECSYFIEASFGSIYPALARLEEEGLVVSRTEQQSGKPSKKVYSITEQGRAAFAEELSGPLGDDVFRSPFLLFARFAHILPRDLVEARANEFLERNIANHRQLEEAFSDRETSASDRWVINYGRAVMEVAERHMRSHMHELINLARAEQKKDAAE